MLGADEDMCQEWLTRLGDEEPEACDSTTRLRQNIDAEVNGNNNSQQQYRALKAQQKTLDSQLTALFRPVVADVRGRRAANGCHFSFDAGHFDGHIRVLSNAS